MMKFMMRTCMQSIVGILVSVLLVNPDMLWALAVSSGFSVKQQKEISFVTGATVKVASDIVGAGLRGSAKQQALDFDDQSDDEYSQVSHDVQRNQYAHAYKYSKILTEKKTIESVKNWATSSKTRVEFLSAEGRDEKTSMVSPYASQKTEYVYADLVEGLGNVVLEDTNVGGLSVAVSGDSIQDLGVIPDMYANQIFTAVPADQKDHIQDVIKNNLEAVSESDILFVLNKIAKAKKMPLKDLDVVMLIRNREGDKRSTLEKLSRANGFKLTTISDGTFAHALSATMDSKSQKVLWTVGGSTEAMINLAIAAQLPGAVGAVKLYSKNIETKGDLVNCFQFDKLEQAGLRLKRQEDGDEIIEGRKIFVPNMVGSQVKASVAAITDSQVLELKGVKHKPYDHYLVSSLELEDKKMIEKRYLVSKNDSTFIKEYKPEIDKKDRLMIPPAKSIEGFFQTFSKMFRYHRKDLNTEECDLEILHEGKLRDYGISQLETESFALGETSVDEVARYVLSDVQSQLGIESTEENKEMPKVLKEYFKQMPVSATLVTTAKSSNANTQTKYKETLESRTEYGGAESAGIALLLRESAVSSDLKSYLNNGETSALYESRDDLDTLAVNRVENGQVKVQYDQGFIDLGRRSGLRGVQGSSVPMLVDTIQGFMKLKELAYQGALNEDQKRDLEFRGLAAAVKGLTVDQMEAHIELLSVHQKELLRIAEDVQAEDLKERATKIEQEIAVIRSLMKANQNGGGLATINFSDLVSGKDLAGDLSTLMNGQDFTAVFA